MLAVAKRLNYAFVRRCLGVWARPTVNGAERLAGGGVVYALPNRSLTDVILLDIVAAEHGLPSPVSALGRP